MRLENGEGFRTVYVGLGVPDSDAVLFEPSAYGPKSAIALVYSHPNGNNFGEPLGREMASRGYRVLMVNSHVNNPNDDELAPSISLGIKFLRSLPDVRKVILVGHSGGGHAAAFYENVAENGPGACSGPEKIYPCDTKRVSRLEKPDALVLLDPTLGAFHQTSSVDPALTGERRDPALDMFTAGNGFDATTKSARYSPAFASRFYAAQASRNASIIADAQRRLGELQSGKSSYSDDEPFVVRGLGEFAAGARLYQPDVRYQSHTKQAHLLLASSGANRIEVIRSVRPPSALAAGNLRSLKDMTLNTTVRRFLAANAVRTLPGYAMTEDDISGVDWSSSMTSTPSNARGIRVPTLMLVMGCHYLVVPGEITFNNLAAKDKTFAAVEGATHVFQPCRAEYGNTQKRVFDFVDSWLSAARRF